MATSYTAAIEEEFSRGVQQNLMAMLVSPEVTNKEAQNALAGGGDTYHKPYIPRGTAATYTKYTDITASTFTAVDEEFTVNTYKIYDFPMDRLDELQLRKAAAVLSHQQKQAAFELMRNIDSETFAEYTNATYKYTGGNISTSSTVSGTALSVSNVADVFGEIQAHLYNTTGARNGMYAVIDPEHARFIQEKAIGNTFNLADSTFRNGYAGDFLGFRVFTSTNLPVAVTLGLATQPTDGDTVTINGVTFTFKTTLGSTEGNVLIGASAAAANTNLAALLNAPGTTTAQGVAISALNQSRLFNLAATAGATSTAITANGRLTLSETLTDGTDTWGTQVVHANFGEFGAIEQVLQGGVRTEITPRELQVGDIYKVYTASKSKTFQEGKDRFVDVQLG